MPVRRRTRRRPPGPPRRARPASARARPGRRGRWPRRPPSAPGRRAGRRCPAPRCRRRTGCSRRRRAARRASASGGRRVVGCTPAPAATPGMDSAAVVPLGQQLGHRAVHGRPHPGRPPAGPGAVARPPVPPSRDPPNAVIVAIEVLPSLLTQRYVLQGALDGRLAHSVPPGRVHRRRGDLRVVPGRLQRAVPALRGLPAAVRVHRDHADAGVRRLRAGADRVAARGRSAVRPHRTASGAPAARSRWRSSRWCCSCSPTASGCCWSPGVVQGVATGAATTALPATLVDLEPRPGRAGLINGVAPLAGLGFGALGCGVLVEFGPAPTQLVWAVLIAGMVLAAAVVAMMPETIERRPGALASLRPRRRRAGADPAAVRRDRADPDRELGARRALPLARPVRRVRAVRAAAATWSAGSS